ncbi:MAG: hypothetical protein H6818_21105 [Phycisphaerales bacterium]|nr:hypothetical protein [Phycisphaerales bacterium]MCB9862291.1 hypothetical protein [Phycisphaerales bacterium]
MRKFAMCSTLIASLAAWQSAMAVNPLPTTIDNFYMHGTQPNSLAPGAVIIPAGDQCTFCHSNGGDEPDPTVHIGREWRGSMMAQAARDPIFYACMDIAEADAPGVGDACIRCHAPKGWLEGRSTPTNGSALTREDRDGITCHFCHRMVDPFDLDNDAPAVDYFVLQGLDDDLPMMSFDRGDPPAIGFNGNGNYVIDPYDRRRGPFPVVRYGLPSPSNAVNCDLYHPGFTFGNCENDLGEDECLSQESPLHRRADMCGTCHDVSFPHVNYDAQGNPSFNGTGNAHPTGNKYDMAAEQRTFSEWLKSDFAQGQGVDMGGRFGSPGQTFVSDCQDCHMPKHAFAKGCEFVSGGRDDIPKHTFRGSNSWVLDAVAMHYGPDGPLPGFPADPQGPELDDDEVTQLQMGTLGNMDFIKKAADLTAELDDTMTPGVPQLKVRVTNQAAHKLPTGYIDGRRMWLTIEYFDCDGMPLQVLGGYDYSTATLDEGSTKVYRAAVGPDPALATVVDLPEAPSFHAAFATKKYFDNRIPPRGFTNAEFEAIQSPVVGYSYADGQHWDDTYFGIPDGAATARITLFHQTTTREYIEFLRDNNPFSATDPQNRGAFAYAMWEAAGKSEPVEMAVVGDSIPFMVIPKGDPNCDGSRSSADIEMFISVLLGDSADPFTISAVDMDGVGGVNGDDIQPFVDQLLLQ